MKKTVWISLAGVLLLLAGALWLAYSSHEEERIARMTKGEAQITFGEVSHDFGNIDANGGPVYHDFEFTNTGRSPLVIEQVKTWCGCLTGEFPEHPIKPGKKGRIRITYDPMGGSDSFTKTADVESNADQCIVILTVSGNVVR